MHVWVCAAEEGDQEFVLGAAIFESIFQVWKFNRLGNAGVKHFEDQSREEIPEFWNKACSVLIVPTHRHHA